MTCYNDNGDKMLKKIIEWRNYIILFIIFLLIIFLIITNNTKKEYIKSFSYFNENITIKLYSTKKMNKTFDKIDTIYKKYQNYLNRPSTDKDYLELVKYSQNIKEKTNNLVLADQDLNLFIDIYATNKVIQYLNENKINQYIISTDGNISAGEHYKNEKYKIGIFDIENNIIDIANIKNTNLIVKGNTEEEKAYMFDQNTGKQASNKLIVVIGKNSNEANYVANALYLMDIKEGQKYVKNQKVEVLWQESGKTTTTKGFKKYLKN